MNPLMDRRVVGAMFFALVAMVALVTSPTTARCSVVWCSCSCSCNVVWCTAISVVYLQLYCKSVVGQVQCNVG